MSYFLLEALQRVVDAERPRPSLWHRLRCRAGGARDGRAPETGPSFAALAASSRSAAHEALGIVLVTAVWLTLLLHRGQALSPFEYASACIAAGPAALLWLLAAPASYQRWRVLVALLLQPAATASVVAASTGRILGASALLGLHTAKGTLAAARGLAAFLALQTGCVAVLLGTVAFPMPPLLGPVLNLVGLAAMAAAANPGTCGGAYLAHPRIATLLGSLYRWLRPAIAPLEPLLLVAGVTRDHPHRHCVCVVVAMQVWLGAAAPTLLLLCTHSRRYRAWRAQQRRLDHERRKKQAAEWSFPMLDPSSSSSGSSLAHSGRSSPPAQQQAPAGRSAAARARQLPPAVGDVVGPLPDGLPAKRRGRRGPDCHPADWQWRAASQALHAMHIGWQGASLLAAGLAALTVWHHRVFP